MSEDGWTLLDVMEENNSNAVTEVIVVAKKENVPSDYLLVSITTYKIGLFSNDSNQPKRPAKPVSLKECFRQNAISPSAKRFPLRRR